MHVAPKQLERLAGDSHSREYNRIKSSSYFVAGDNLPEDVVLLESAPLEAGIRTPPPGGLEPPLGYCIGVLPFAQVRQLCCLSSGGSVVYMVDDPAIPSFR